jgi:nucleoside-diphosphate-sugar epimerase
VKRVLVTGGSSLIGRSVAGRLTRRGDEVVVFQRNPTVGGSDTDLPGDQVLGDIRDAAALADAIRGCTAVIHLAAKVGVVGTWEDYRSTNVDGTRNVIDAMRTARITSLVHVSSPSVAHGGQPIVGAVAEPALVGRRRAHYAESKAIAERLALGAASEQLGVVVLRPHLVWGPGDTQLVGRIVDRAAAGRLALVGGGRALIDTLYIDNAADALVAAVDRITPRAECSGKAYVIANGEPRPIRELVAGICDAAGIEFQPRHVPVGVATRLGGLVERSWPLLRTDAEPPLTRFLAEQLGTAHWFDPRPAAVDLEWLPKVSIDEGLGRLAEWFTAGGFSGAQR